MTTPTDDQNQARPYGPPVNVTMVLARLRSRNLPDRIDADYLRDCGVPEGTLSRTLFGLRFLGLINDAGAPGQDLRAIHTATDEEYQQILASCVHTAYADVFDVIDIAEEGQDRILNFFRRYSPASQRQRMVIFFLGMCREAGLATLDTPRNRQMGTGTKPKKPGPKTVPLSRKAGRGDAVVMSPSPRRAAGIAPALEGLVLSLPAPGTPITSEQRRQWLNMAEATLGFLYPFKPSIAEPVDGLSQAGFEDESDYAQPE